MRAELFVGALKEVHEETGVALSDLLPPVLLGVVLDDGDAGKPSLLFATATALSSEEVMGLYGRGAPDAFESTALVRVTVADAMALGEQAEALCDGKRACADEVGVEGLTVHSLEPCTQAAMLLFRDFVAEGGVQRLHAAHGAEVPAALAEACAVFRGGDGK